MTMHIRGEINLEEVSEICFHFQLPREMQGFLPPEFKNQVLPQVATRPRRSGGHPIFEANSVDVRELIRDLTKISFGFDCHKPVMKDGHLRLTSFFSTRGAGISVDVNILCNSFFWSVKSFRSRTKKPGGGYSIAISLGHPRAFDQTTMLATLWIQHGAICLLTGTRSMIRAS